MSDSWRTVAKAIAGPLKKTYESDWMLDANCAVSHPNDLSFLVCVEELFPVWEKICKQCPVSLQCMEWADKHEPSGVFIAGEWRE